MVMVLGIAKAAIRTHVEEVRWMIGASLRQLVGPPNPPRAQRRATNTSQGSTSSRQRLHLNAQGGCTACITCLACGVAVVWCAHIGRGLFTWLGNASPRQMGNPSRCVWRHAATGISKPPQASA